MAAPTGVGGMVVFGRRDRGIAAAATPPGPKPLPRTTFDRTGAPGGVGITVPGERSSRRTPTPTIPTTNPDPPTPPLPSWSDRKCPSRYAARPPRWQRPVNHHVEDLTRPREPPSDRRRSNGCARRSRRRGGVRRDRPLNPHPGGHPLDGHQSPQSARRSTRHGRLQREPPLNPHPGDPPPTAVDRITAPGRVGGAVTFDGSRR